MKTDIFKNLIAFIVISLLCNTAFAISPGRASINGIVVDNATGNPIEYANLVLHNSVDSTLITGSISSTDGSFIIEELKNGKYYLKVQFIGYQTVVINNIEINSKKDIVNLGTIKIAPSSINLQQAEIIATNDYISFKIDKTIINVQEQISAEGSAVVDALINVPSIQVDGGGNVSLRGSTSFTLLIDGHPSVLNPSDALNQIPSGSVDKIEIITNPSVKYDSDGTTGIINLVMKKQKTNGTSGQATLTVATGDKYSGNILFSQRSKSLRTNFGATYSNKRKQTESTDYRTTFMGDSTNNQSIASDRDIYRINYKISGGIFWDANSSNSFSLNAEVGQWEYDRRINSSNYFFNSYQSDSTHYEVVDKFKIINKYISGDLGYSHNFKKDDHKLDVNLFYTKLNNESPNSIEQFISDESGIENKTGYQILNSSSDRNHIRFKTDYTLPISKKLDLEAGYQNDTKSSNSHYSYSTQTLNNLITDTSLIDKMDFQRIVNSFYGILGADVIGVSIKAGLKIEFVNRSLKEEKSQIKYELSEINLFPSLHIAKELKNEQQVIFSYSRRVNRPNEWMLIPAVSSTGRNMLQLGNPELLPDFTNSFELSYSKRNDIIILSSQLYTRYTKNVISSSVTERSGIFYQSYENLDRELSSGVELITNINIKTWWRMNVSANAYYYSLDGKLASGYSIDNNSFMWNGSFRTTFIVKGSTYLEFLAIYYGPSILPQGKSKDFYYFDFFVKRNFFNRNLTVALRSHNTFDTGIYIEDSKGTNYNVHTWFKYEGPTFMATITYRLNNFKRHRSSNQPDMNFDSGLDQ